MTDVVNNPGDRPDGRALRWETHRTQRRAEFVRAAVRAVEKHGPDVQIEQIAEEAGVPRPRLYRYFDGKIDLELAVAVYAADILMAEFTPHLGDRGSTRQIATGLLTVWVRWVITHSDLYRFMLRLNTTGHQGQPGSYTHIRKTIIDQSAQLLGARYAMVDADDNEVATFTAGLFGFIESATNQWLDDPAGQSSEQLIENLVRWTMAVMSETITRHGIPLDSTSRA